MQVQIIESNRGGKIALHYGHSYSRKQSTNNCIHWRCTNHYKLKCPAILKTKNETVIETKGTHNHECDPGECKAKDVVNQIKRRAEYSTPTVAIANEIYEISDDYAVQLAMPKKDKLLRAVSRKRQKAMSSNTCPNWSKFWRPWWVCSLPPTRQWKRWQGANSNIWRRNNEKLTEFIEYLVSWWNF